MANSPQMKKKTKTVRISKPLHSLVKKHVSTTGMKLESWIEKAVETALNNSAPLSVLSSKER